LDSDFGDLNPANLPGNPGNPGNFDTFVLPGPDDHYSDRIPSFIRRVVVDNVPRDIVYNYTIPAIQISLRVWDLKTEQTRQITIIQDM
jgi:hypothetical protein